MSTTPELSGDRIDIDLGILGPKADACFARFDFFKKASDQYRFNGANMIDQAFSVFAGCTTLGVVRLFEPEVSDLVLFGEFELIIDTFCLLYTSPSPRDKRQSRMPSSA